MGGPIPAISGAAPTRLVSELDGGVVEPAPLPAWEPPLPAASVPRVDPLFVAGAVGPKSRAAVASLLYTSVTGRIREATTSGRALLARLGAGEPASRETFIAAIALIRDALLADDARPVRVDDHWTAPANEVAFAKLCAGFVGEADAPAVARLLWEGVDPIAGMHDTAGLTNPDSRQRDALDAMFTGAVAMHERFRALEAQVAAERPATDATAKLQQTFEWLSQFPDLVPDVYADAQLDVQGLPPVARPGTATAESDAWVIACGAEWHARHRRNELLTNAGLVALGIVATIVGGAVAGPSGGIAAGMVIAIAAGAWQVHDALSALDAARTAEQAGIGSNATISARTDDVIGASAALAVNVLSAGLFARLGGAGVSRAVVRGVARELVTDGLKAAAIGGGTGLVATAMHPGVWKSDDTLGLLAEATVTSALFATAGFAAGKVVSFGLPRGAVLSVGGEVLVEHEGVQRAARVKALSASRDEVTLSLDGAEITVRVNKLVGLVSTRSPLSTLRRVLLRENTPGAVPMHRVLTSEPFAAQPVRLGETVQLVLDAHTTHQARLVAKRGGVLSFEVLDAPRSFRVDLSASTLRTNARGEGLFVVTDVARASYKTLAERLPGVSGFKAWHAARAGTSSPPAETVEAFIARVSERYAAVSVGKGLGRGHYWLWRAADGEGAALWPTDDRAWDHNRSFSVGPAAELSDLAVGQVVDSRGAPVPPARNLVFGAHGAPLGFQRMSTGRAATLIADQIIALNETLPPERRVRFCTLLSCSQGDRPIAQALGPTNAQRLQAAINQRLAERGVSEPLTVLASDRPGETHGAAYNTLYGRNVGRPRFIPAEQQAPEQFLTTRDYAIAIAQQAGFVTVLAGTGAAVIFLADALVDE